MSFNQPPKAFPHERTAQAFIAWSGQVLHSTEIDLLNIRPQQDEERVWRRQDLTIDTRIFDVELRMRSFSVTYKDQDEGLKTFGLPIEEASLYRRIEQLEHSLAETKADLHITQAERDANASKAAAFDRAREQLVDSGKTIAAGMLDFALQAETIMSAKTEWHKYEDTL